MSMKSLLPGQCFRLPNGEQVVVAVYLYPQPENTGHVFTVVPTGRILRLDKGFWEHDCNTSPGDGAVYPYAKVCTALTVNDLVRDPQHDLGWSD